MSWYSLMLFESCLWPNYIISINLEKSNPNPITQKKKKAQNFRHTTAQSKHHCRAHHQLVMIKKGKNTAVPIPTKQADASIKHVIITDHVLSPEEVNTFLCLCHQLLEGVGFSCSTFPSESTELTEKELLHSRPQTSLFPFTCVCCFPWFIVDPLIMSDLELKCYADKKDNKALEKY